MLCPLTLARRLACLAAMVVLLAGWEASRLRLGSFMLGQREPHVAIDPGTGCAYLYHLTRKVVPCVSQDPEKTLLATGLGGSGTWRTALALREAGLLVEHEGVSVDGSVSWLYAVRAGSYPCVRANSDTVTRFRKVLHVVRCPVHNVAALSTHKRTTLSFAARAVGLTEPPLDNDQGDRYRISQARLLNPFWLRFLTELWVAWNERIATYSDGLARLEDQDPGHTLCDRAGIPVRHNLTCTSTASAAAQAWGRLRHTARDFSNRVFGNGDYNPARCLRGRCGDESNATSVRFHHRKHPTITWLKLRAALDRKLTTKLVATAKRFGYYLPDHHPDVGPEHDSAALASNCALLPLPAALRGVRQQNISTDGIESARRVTRR